jgi:hypothetical protein
MQVIKKKACGFKLHPKTLTAWLPIKPKHVDRLLLYHFNKGTALN